MSRRTSQRIARPIAAGSVGLAALLVCIDVYSRFRGQALARYHVLSLNPPLARSTSVAVRRGAAEFFWSTRETDAGGALLRSADWSEWTHYAADVRPADPPVAFGYRRNDHPIGWARVAGFEVGVPIWPLAVGAAVPAVFVAIRHRRRPPPGHCRRCGYDLRATPGRCPECGASAGERDG